MHSKVEEDSCPGLDAGKPHRVVHLRFYGKSSTFFPLFYAPIVHRRTTYNPCSPSRTGDHQLLTILQMRGRGV